MSIKAVGFDQEREHGSILLKFPESCCKLRLQLADVFAYFSGADAVLGGQLPQVAEVAESGGGHVI